MVWSWQKMTRGKNAMEIGEAQRNPSVAPTAVGAKEGKTILAIIPVRMGSTRFPGKPMAPILGIPMLAHVWARTRMCRALTDVVVATCDEEIRGYGLRFGMNVVMTSITHERASDRCAEALQIWEQRHGKRADIVVMVQGDEPMLTPEMIDMAVRPLLNDPTVMVTNLLAPIIDLEELNDPNEIKVVADQSNNALYFSRAPIPSQAKWKGELRAGKQVCIIPFRRDYLLEYLALSPTPLEQIESIDMLRILEHGGRVKMVSEQVLTYSVDTPEDLKLVEQAMTNDPLVAHYRGQFDHVLSS